VESVATPLALIEFFGALVIVALLLVALAWKRRLLTGVLVVAIVFGVVFENPIGVVVKESDVSAQSLTPSDQADGALHWLKITGVPIAWFTPYNQEYPWAGLYENSPRSVLKVRYGLTFLPSTGATSVVQQCDGTILKPCWGGDRGDDYPLVYRDAAGRAYLVPLTKTYVPSAQGQSPTVSVAHVYSAKLGIASWRALGYWLLVAVAIVVASRSPQLRRRSLAIAGGAAVLCGLVFTGAIALAVLPAPLRESSSVTPELLPERADDPASAGVAQLTPIETYAADCMQKIEGAVRNTCGRLEDLTAVEAAGRILAIWTAEDDRLMQLRVRRLTLAGKPLGAGSTTIRRWEQTDGNGHDNCDVPYDLQSVRLADGNVLVGYSRFCDLRGGGPEHPTITGALLSPTGELLREPFPLISWDNGRTAQTSPHFWLRATSAGVPILVWEGPTRTQTNGRGLFMSALDSGLQAGAGREFASEYYGFGSVAIACKESCLVAQGDDEGITLRHVSTDGRVLWEKPLRQPSGRPGSELVASADQPGYLLGWLDSDGVNVDGYLARVQPHGQTSVQRVARQVPAGDGMHGLTPDPLGIASGRRALVFDTAGASDDEFLLHAASDGSLVSKTLEVRMGDATMIGDVLIAAAGLFPTKPTDPVSVDLS
jgi:hypothetical protein